MFRGRTRKPSGRQNVERFESIVNPDCGLSFVETYIDSTKARAGAVTELRILPSLSPEGLEEDILNPDPPEDAEFGQVFGQWAYELELLRSAGFSRSSFITETWTDKSGNTVMDRWTAGRVFSHRLYLKLKDVEKNLMARGVGSRVLPSDGIPSEWQNWIGRWDNGHWKSFLKSIVPYPQDTILVQACFIRIAGDPILDPATGEETWKTGCVTMLPRGVAVGFFDNLRKRRDPRAPLSVTNNLCGDPCSCEGGCRMLISKYNKAQREGEESWSYQVTLDRQPTPLPLNWVAEQWKPWDQVLQKTTIEDVVENLAKTFSWQAVGFALRGSKYEKYVPQHALEEGAHVIGLGEAPAAAELPVYEQEEAAAGLAPVPPPPVKAPTAPPVRIPAAPPVRIPTSPPVKAPTAPPVKAPTVPPVRTPTSPPVKAPTTPPVKSPATSSARPPTGIQMRPPPPSTPPPTAAPSAPPRAHKPPTTSIPLGISSGTTERFAQMLEAIKTSQPGAASVPTEDSQEPLPELPEDPDLADDSVDDRPF